MRRFWVVFCLAICYNYVFAQNKSADSLASLLQKPMPDSQRANVLWQLGDIYQVKPQKAIPYYKEAYKISSAQSSENINLKGRVAASISQLYRLSGDSANALLWLDSSLATINQITDIDVVASIYQNAAVYHCMLEQYPQALDISHHLIHFFDSAGEPEKSGVAYLLIGTTYFKMEQDSIAIDNYRMAFRYAGLASYPGYLKKESSRVIKNASIEIAQAFAEEEKYDSSLYYADKGYKQSVELDDEDGQCTMLEMKATDLQALGKYKESLAPGKLALDIALNDSIAYQVYAADAAIAIGYAHIGQKDSALLYANRCNSSAKQSIINKEDWVDVYDMWVSVYQSLGDYKQAFGYEQKEMEAYKDYRDNEVNKAINRSEIQFETKRKEEQIDTLNQLARKQQTIQYTIAAALLVTLAAAIGFWLSYRNKKRAAAILDQSNKEKEIFLKEIHHRVKNNLQIISSLLYLQFKDYKDEKLIKALQQAQQRIKSMALVHNKLYEKQDVVHVYLKEYINDLVAGILASNNPEGKNINIDVHEDGNNAFSLDTSISIGLILNEVITNSCKYAFINRQEGNISISISKHDDKYSLYIADDGEGLPDDFEKKNSLGVRLVKNLARQMGGEASFVNKNGTEITILFTETAAA